MTDINFRIKNLFLIMALCICVNAQCQFIYTKQSLTNNYFNTICEEQHTSNYLLGNSNYTFYPNGNVRYHTEIMKLSPAGQLISTMPMDSNVFFQGPVIPVNNFYYIAASRCKNFASGGLMFYPLVLKYDLNFNLVKTLVLDSGALNHGYGSVKIIEKSNRLYAACLDFGMNTGYIFTRLFKLDRDLNLLDSVTMHSSQAVDMTGYNNNILLSGLGFPQGSSFGYQQVLEMDTSFNVLSRCNLDSVSVTNRYALQVIGLARAANIVQAGAGSYYVTGSTPFNQWPDLSYYDKTVSAVIKNNSRVLHSQVIGRDSMNTNYSQSICTTSKRYNFIYSVAAEGADNTLPAMPQNRRTRMLIHKTDTAGNLVWANYYGGDRYYAPFAICATADSGLVISGMSYDTIMPAVANVGEGFVMKLGRRGNQEYVSIADHGKINSSYHRYYPNPVKDEIYFDIPFEEQASVCIYTLSGTEVFKTDSYRSLSGLNIAGLTKGAYVYKIKTRHSQHYSGRFLKE